MKKRFLAIVLALAMCLGLAVPAFAAGDAVSVTDAGISFDATTGKYDNAKEDLGWDEKPEAEFLYDLGMVGAQLAEDDYGYGTLWAYLVRDDVKLDFHVKKGEKFSITGYYLTKSGEGFYDSIFIRDMWFSPKEDDSAPVDREFVNDFFPGANYLVCCQGQEYDPDHTISVVFADEKGEPSTVPAFTDVAPDAYYAAPVAWAVQNEITSGTGDNRFSPAQDCTNAQILTFIWRAYGKPEPAIDDPFANSIPDGYKSAAVWAYEKGMVSGAAFDADKPCTRAMAMTYLWQAAGSPETEPSGKFTDVAVGAPYAQAVAWAVANGITQGATDTTFAPENICQRGQIAVFLYNALARKA